MSKKARMLLIFMVLLVIVSLLPACGAAENKAGAPETKAVGTKPEASGYPMQIVDSLGREIVIENEPQRIITMVPNLTEIVFALGRGDRLAGRTEYCDYPAEVTEIASVGDLYNPNLEQIAALKPDLLLTSTNLSPETLKKIEDLQITTVIVAEEESFEGVYNSIRFIGKILNATAKAEEIVADMQEKVDFVKQSVAGKEKPSVYYVIGYGKSGDYTAGRDTFIGQLIEMAGGSNAAADTEKWQYSLERLLEKNPNILICPQNFGYKEGLAVTNGYRDLDAVRNGQVFEIDANLIERHGPRLADGLLELARIIHPEIME